jgi:nicotinamide-nucleotide amidase
MKIEVIAIGDEVLSGDIVNYNSAFISKQLREKGYLVSRHSVLPDKEELLIKGLEESTSNFDLVIATGGLGPTFDDTTKKAICKLLNVDMQFDPICAQKIKSFCGDRPEIKDQASIPKGTKVFINEVGTAPGIIVETGKTKLIFLPGVPQEMKDMWQKSVLPYIETHFPLKKKTYEKVISLCLIRELEIENDLKLLKEKNPELKIGIYPSYGLLRLNFSIEGEEKEAAKNKLDVITADIYKKFSSNIFPENNLTISQALHELCINKKKKIAFAESCTGGGLAFAITQMPGSSSYFLGSIVAYSNDVKKEVLKVNEETLEKYGAVSIETVKEMTKGVFDITDADYVISVSGVAGPSGGSEEKPVGSVYLAIAQRGEVIDAGMIKAPASRSTAISFVTGVAFSILWRKMFYELPYFSL